MAMLQGGEQMVDKTGNEVGYIHVRLLTYFRNFSLLHVSPAYMICHQREAVVRRNGHFKIISYTCMYIFFESEKFSGF
jgi:hypothetical protein